MTGYQQETPHSPKRQQATISQNHSRAYQMTCLFSKLHLTYIVAVQKDPTCDKYSHNCSSLFHFFHTLRYSRAEGLDEIDGQEFHVGEYELRRVRDIDEGCSDGVLDEIV